MSILTPIILFVLLISTLSIGGCSVQSVQDTDQNDWIIGIQIWEEFLKQNNQILDADCRKDIEEQLFIGLIVQSVYRKTLTGKHEKLNKQLCDVNEGFAKNPDKVEQDVFLETFFEWNHLDSYSMYISKLSGICGIIEFLTAQNESISIRLAGDEKYIGRSKKAIRSLTPVTKLKIKPFSSSRVHFNYYTFDNVWNYKIDFRMSSRSIIHVPTHLKYCLPAIWPKLPLNILEFLENNPNFPQSIKYANDGQPKLVNDNGKFILKGFPLTERLSTAEVETEILDNE